MQSHELGALLHPTEGCTKKLSWENNPEGTGQISTKNCDKTVAGKLANKAPWGRSIKEGNLELLLCPIWKLLSLAVV